MRKSVSARLGVPKRRCFLGLERLVTSKELVQVTTTSERVLFTYKRPKPMSSSSDSSFSSSAGAAASAGASAGAEPAAGAEEA